MCSKTWSSHHWFLTWTWFVVNEPQHWYGLLKWFFKGKREFNFGSSAQQYISYDNMLLITSGNTAVSWKIGPTQTIRQAVNKPTKSIYYHTVCCRCAHTVVVAVFQVCSRSVVQINWWFVSNLSDRLTTRVFLSRATNKSNPRWNKSSCSFEWDDCPWSTQIEFILQMTEG